jgi:hypothetical protein
MGRIAFSERCRNGRRFHLPREPGRLTLDDGRLERVGNVARPVFDRAAASLGSAAPLRRRSDGGPHIPAPASIRIGRPVYRSAVLRVAWLFSLIRSGSSVTAYAAAAPWDHAVADEPFGPWDRTAAPYNYPGEQASLMTLFDAAGHTIDDRVRLSAARFFNTLGRGSGAVIVKIPHDRPVPEDAARAFPDHRFAYLLRNPLHRLNSLYYRGQIRPVANGLPGPIGPNHDLAGFTAFARRWRAEPDRLLYDDLHRDPRRFFGTLYRAWGWEYTPADVDRAADYARTHYHAASKLIAPRSNPRNVVSVAHRALPDEVIEAYLADPFVRELMAEAGWSVNPDDYRAATSAVTPASPPR